MKVIYQQLLDIYDKEIRINCRNKNKVYNFEKYKIQNITSIYNSLINNDYKPRKYNIFIIRDPKYRIVMSLSIRDKTINHYLARHILIPKLEKYLEMRNIATRKNMGSDYGIKLVKKYLEKNKKYGKFYILKLDIKKYFYSIDHNVLKSLLVDKLESDEYDIVSTIIDSTNASYINENIRFLKEKMIAKYPKIKDKINELPYYEYDKGLSLGAMTSQFLSIFYLYKLDHYIIHDLHLKYMIRYMDDYIIIHHDKDYLRKCLSDIESKLKNEYKLNINIKKTKITDNKEGFVFLGYRFQIKNKKTIIKIKSETIQRGKKRIKKMKYLYDKDIITLEKYFCSINTYYYSFKYSNLNKFKRIVDRNLYSSG